MKILEVRQMLARSYNLEKNISGKVQNLLHLKLWFFKIMLKLVCDVWPMIIVGGETLNDDLSLSVLIGKARDASVLTGGGSGWSSSCWVIFTSENKQFIFRQILPTRIVVITFITLDFLKN